MGKRNRNELLTYSLNKIYSDNIQIKQDERKENLQVVEDVIKALLPVMKQVDPLFKELYNNNVYTGSAYEGLRVGSPTEFDINWVLSMPFKESDVEIFCHPQTPGFVQFYVQPRAIKNLDPIKWKKFRTFFNKNSCLLRSKVQNWVQSVFAQAVESQNLTRNLRDDIVILEVFDRNSFEPPRNVLSIMPKYPKKKRRYRPPKINKTCRYIGECALRRIRPPRKRGPAFTYTITTVFGKKIDVDLVPVLDGCYEIPESVHQSKRFLKLKKEHKAWYMVPKPYEKKNVEESETLWRLAFPEAEKNLLKQLESKPVKKLIRLFKFLRDCQRWHKICSYYIKTLFLLELDQYQNWTEDNLGTVFMMMLVKLNNILRNGRVECYFNRNLDLLNAIKHMDTRINYANRIKRMIKYINDDPNRINEFMYSRENEKFLNVT